MLDRDQRVLAERYGPHVLLLFVVGFMFWVRMLPADRVITDSTVFFSGNDAWYHKRMTHYAVRYSPHTTPFDPWSNFPFGTGRHSGFGGLFDQLVALAALVVGLGSPSDRLINVVLAVAPPIFGALTAIPTYFIARHLTDRWGGLVAAGILALSSGGILFRTIVGASDHQSAEPLFSTIAVAGFVFALVTAYRESPMLEDVQDRNWEYLQTPVLAGIAGGVAVAAYLTLWPPGVMLLFTFGVFVVFQLSRDHYAGEATDHLTIATVVPMVTAGVLTLLYARSYDLEATAFSLLQPLVAFGVAAGTLVLFGLSRYAEQEGYERRYYPPTVAVLVLVSFVLLWIVYPRGVDLLQQLVVRIYSFGLLTSPSAGTVAEIQPATIDTAFAAFGTILFLAVGGFVILSYAVVRENRPVVLLVLLWSLSMFAAYFTMARFGYYFAVNVAILSAYAIWWISTKLLAIDVDLDESRDIDLYQILGILLLLLLVVPGNVVATSGSQPVWDQAERLGGTDLAWYEAMNWLQSNSPELPLGYYERYDRPADGDFNYPPGAYGVMSWWDYGHWITVMGHRIPYTNPFQEGPVPASAYLQAADETRANLILEVLPLLSENPARIATMSTAELRDVAADQSPEVAGENGKYVVIDDEMAGEKFPAITQWAGPRTSAYFKRSQYQIRGQNVSLPETTARYDETMLADLYYQDARGLSHYRLVHEVDQYSVVGGSVTGNRVRALTSIPLRGGWGRVASLANSLREAKSTTQAVSLGRGRYVYNANVESRVKIYEHVDGATLTGTVPNAENGTAVYAVLELQTHTGRNFTYVQQASTGPDGSFEMTVPYPTNGGVAPANGGTDSSVEALGEYSIRVGNLTTPSTEGSVVVPEAAIYGGDTIEVQIGPRTGENTSREYGNPLQRNDGQ